MGLSTHCAVGLLLATVLLSDVVYAGRYECDGNKAGNINIANNEVVMEKGCVFSADSSTENNYVTLDISGMGADARSSGHTKLTVSITETEFDNTGLHFKGVKSSQRPAIPFQLLMTKSNINIKNDGGSALQFTDFLPENSHVTIKGSVFKTKAATTVLMSSLTLSATAVLLEKNEWSSKSSIWGMTKKGDTITITKGAVWIWDKNALSTENNDLKANVEAWTQEYSDLQLSGSSAIVWTGNAISVTANMYARPWYQYMSTTTLTDGSNITWTDNTITSIATPTAESYPYIWYSHSVVLNQSSVIAWTNNKLTTYSPFFGRIWYQRVVLTVNHSSRITWDNNDMNVSVEPEAASGDVSVWYQGSIFKKTDTVTEVSNNGSITWTRNNITLNGGNDAYIWRQRSVTVSNTKVSTKGVISWNGNTINATVYNGKAHGWYVDKAFSTDIVNDGTVEFINNQMKLNSGSTTNCFFCWEGRNYTVADATLTVENNTIAMSSNKKDSRLGFVNGQGNVETHFKNALLRIDSNNITTNGNLRLALLWEFITERLHIDDRTRILMCYNKASYGRVTKYKQLVYPASLAQRLVAAYCPFTATRTISKTHTLPTTTTTTTATTTNASVNDSELERGKNDDAGAAKDDDKGVCVWCIVVPILLVLLLCCLILLLLCCCCRRKRDEHKVLDDVEAVHVVNVAHEANEHFTDIEKTQVIHTHHRVNVERYEGVEEAAPAPAVVNPLQIQ